MNEEKIEVEKPLKQISIENIKNLSPLLRIYKNHKADCLFKGFFMTNSHI